MKGGLPLRGRAREVGLSHCYATLLDYERSSPPTLRKAHGSREALILHARTSVVGGKGPPFFELQLPVRYPFTASR